MSCFQWMIRLSFLKKVLSKFIHQVHWEVLTWLLFPDYTGENAVSGDVLQGEIESSLFTSIGERLDPIQTKLEHVIVSADTLFKNINDILDQRTIQSVKNSVKTLEQSLGGCTNHHTSSKWYYGCYFCKI